MSVKKKRYLAVSQKLEVVQARQKGLTLKEVGDLYGVHPTAVGRWTKAYETGGIAGLESAPRNGTPTARTSAAEQALKEITRADPEAGVGKAQGALYRHGLLRLARETVRKLLRRNGHGPQNQRVRRRNKPPQPKFFERANPNDLWQTDIMTFMLKGQYRVYLIGFMDDHSRFLVGWGLYRFQTAANVQEVFRAAIEKHGLPKEVLSDNGRQYYSWRGKSQFTEMLLKLGIRHIRSRPYRPQTLGKIESFWRNLLQECLSRIPLSTFEEAKEKIGEFIEYYNFKRPHQGIGNLTPSDRFYRVGDQVKQIIAANTAKTEEAAPFAAIHTPPTYIVGNIGGRELRVVAKDAEVTLTEREKIESASGGDHGADKTSESERAVGVDSGGVGETGDGGEPLPSGRGVAGAVLSVDEGGAGSGDEGAGGQSAGPETVSGSATDGGETAQGAAGPGGEGQPPASQGTRPLSGVDGSGAADHPAQRVGSVSGGI